MHLVKSLLRGELRPGPGWTGLVWAALALLGPLVAAAQEPGPVVLQLDQEVLSENQPLTGLLTGDWSGKVVRVLWVDETGRVIGHAEPRIDRKRPEGVRFTLSNQGAKGNAHRVVAIVQIPAKDKQVSSAWQIVARATFRTAKAPSNATFPVFVSGAERDKPSQELAIGPILNVGQLAKTPFLPPSCPILMEAGLPLRSPLNPRSAREGETDVLRFLADRKPIIRVPDLFDATGWQKLRGDMSSAARQARPFGPTAYALGDSLSLGLGRSAYEFEPDTLSLEIFRGWLRKRYDSLSALNQQWGTTFERWDEVAPLTTDQIKAAHSPSYAAWLDLVMQGDPEQKLQRREDRPFFAADLKTMPVPGAENFSSWCDWHAFLDFSFARMAGEVRSAMRKGDPQAQVGYLHPLPPSPWGGQDIYELARITDWTAMPPDPVMALLLESFRPEARRYLLQERGPTVQALWDGWLQNSNGMILPGGEDTLPPDDPRQKLLCELSRLAPYRDGFDAAADAVALYYSPRSVAVHWMLDSQLDGSDWARRGVEGAIADSPWLDWTAWVYLLHDLGFAPRFVAPAQLLAGQVKAKVLILPKVIALSSREADAIRDFTLHGGIVIADSQCGLFDEHGRRFPLPRGGGAVGLLDADFGVRRENLWAHELNGAFHGDPASARVTLLDPTKVGAMGPSSAELRVNEPGLRPTGAWRFGRSAAEAAAVLTRNGGTGRFIYLNLAMQDYPELRLRTETDFQFAGINDQRYARMFGTPTGGEALRILVGDMLAQAIGEPSVLVRGSQGEPIRGIACHRWERQDAVLLALQPPAAGWAPADPPPIASPWEPAEKAKEEPQDGPRSSTLQVFYRRPMHWYDLRKGGYLGQGPHCSIPVVGQEPVLLAGLPSRLEQIRTRTRRLDRAGVFTVEIQLETTARLGDRKDESLLLTAELLAPDGTVIPEYTQQLVLKDPSWTTTVSLGFNEPPGLYRLRIRDCASGVTGEAHLLKEDALYQDLFPPVTKSATPSGTR